MGYALFLAQSGERHPSATRLRGDLRGLIEVRDDWRGNTYRLVYTDKLRGAVYVLHAFQKKSHHGGAVPQQHRKTIITRFGVARRHHATQIRSQRGDSEGR